ncbi:MAG: hypothetical protein LUQ50_13605 [Methanospirillum sp.]|uniref:hypothetical protein n=1 Tax=Methanospirillum sp. TaxID=45200 RepID=UPI00236DF46A|nr:hypothetical protein [Methanospirillum sp.]MDD1730092.1 hypothetical protein [Methanospirillum sp.]
MKRVTLIPPIIADIVYLAVTGVAGVQFLEASFCPDCAGLLISHDLKQRRFSTVLTPTGPDQIYVQVKRFHCRECGRLCYADAPFYENSRFGSPVVDLCVALSKDFTYSQTATILKNIGIVIDRGTVRKTVLAHTHEIDLADLFGIRLPRSVLSLSTLMTDADPLRPISGRDVLQACGFPVS